jgi:hypothetical protein
LYPSFYGFRKLKEFENEKGEESRQEANEFKMTIGHHY